MCEPAADADVDAESDSGGGASLAGSDAVPIHAGAETLGSG